MSASPSRFERGFAHIFVLIILVIGVVIGIYLVQNPQIFRPQASESSAVCKASDPSSLTVCLAKAETDSSITQIEITKQITCTNKTECSFNLTQRNKPLTIFGTPNTGAGFKRITNYDYPLFVVGNLYEPDAKKRKEVRDVTIKDLIFDDTTASCDFITKTMDVCNSPIVLVTLINPVLDNITILHAKAHGIQIRNVFNLVLKNSKIVDSDGDGVWFDSALPPGCSVDFENYKLCPIDDTKISTIVQIENNLFAENKIAAVEVYASANAQYPSSIKGNLFVHNHRDSQYLFCPIANPSKGILAGHCPGGQLVISRSKHMIVEENVIRDGKIDAVDPIKGTTYHQQGLLATGIELSDTIEHITIKNNKIYNNTGAGIFADYVGEKYKVGSVNIFWNMVYGNGLKFAGAGYPDLERAPFGFGFINNIGERADVAFREAFIFADPPVCVPSTPNGQCSSTIHWYTNDYKDINVRLPSNPELLFAFGVNGKQVAPWVAPVGVMFALEEPATKSTLDSVFAKAEGTIIAPPTNNPTSNPTPTQLPTLPPISTPIPTPVPPIQTPAPVVTPKPVVASPTPTPVSRKTIILKAEPSSCTLKSTGLCTVKISWNTDAYRTEFDSGEPIKISLRENPEATFAYAASGAQDAPWIGINGATFEAYYKGVLVDSLFVKGIKP